MTHEKWTDKHPTQSPRSQHRFMEVKGMAEDGLRALADYRRFLDHLPEGERVQELIGHVRLLDVYFQHVTEGTWHHGREAVGQSMQVLLESTRTKPNKAQSKHDHDFNDDRKAARQSLKAADETLKTAGFYTPQNPLWPHEEPEPAPRKPRKARELARIPHDDAPNGHQGHPRPRPGRHR